MSFTGRRDAPDLERALGVALEGGLVSDTGLPDEVLDALEAVAQAAAGRAPTAALAARARALLA